MFGYVKTDMPNMFVKDTVLYKAMYCGLCKGIGNVCGTKGRLLLNYDLAFLSLLTAIIVVAPSIAQVCCTAPEIPNATYIFGAIILPVNPTCLS